MKLTPKQFEDFAKKRLKEMVEDSGEFIVIAGFIDVYGDGALAVCTKCHTPVWVRPFVLEAVDQYNIKVVCICCADPQATKGQIIMDLAKIEVELKEEF